MQIHYVVVNVLNRLGSRVAQDQLLDVSLEHAEEALRRRVVSAVADLSHAGESVATANPFPRLAAGVLRTPVRMNHDLPAGLDPLPPGHRQRPQHKIGCLDGYFDRVKEAVARELRAFAANPIDGAIPA